LIPLQDMVPTKKKVIEYGCSDILVIFLCKFLTFQSGKMAIKCWNIIFILSRLCLRLKLKQYNRKYHDNSMVFYRNNLMIYYTELLT